ncbi:MAG: peptidoglycan-associated lipoprotein [Myxococcota bacterium]|jgi:peptidoglycan-associated lipoprotein
MITAKQLALAAAILLLTTGCGPKYPECATDDQCASQGQVCVGGVCKACRDDSQCSASDLCVACNGYACTRRPGCCTSDADCPGGSCWNVAGTALGQCGAQCGEGKACPPGQRCDAQGQCQPDVECSASVPCPPGQRCDNGSCVTSCSLSTVNFDFNESRVRLDQQDTLNANAECVKNMGKTVRISGHCDERGTEEYNMALGERRASASKRYLGNLGISSSSMRTISYGEEQPTCTTSNEGCWSQNRRADFTFE